MLKDIAPGCGVEEKKPSVIIRFTSYQERHLVVFGDKKNLKDLSYNPRGPTAQRASLFKQAVELHSMSNASTIDGNVIWVGKDYTRDFETQMSDLLQTR